MNLTHLVMFEFWTGASGVTVSISVPVQIEAVEITSPWLQEVEITSPWIDEVQT